MTDLGIGFNKIVLTEKLIRDLCKEIVLTCCGDSKHCYWYCKQHIEHFIANYLVAQSERLIFFASI